MFHLSKNLNNRSNRDLKIYFNTSVKGAHQWKGDTQLLPDAYFYILWNISSFLRLLKLLKNNKLRKEENGWYNTK